MARRKIRICVTRARNARDDYAAADKQQLQKFMQKVWAAKSCNRPLKTAQWAPPLTLLRED